MRRHSTASLYLALLCFALLTCGSVLLAAPPKPTGTWKIKSNFGSRTRISMLKLDLEEGQLTGELFRRPGEGTKIENARIDDGVVTFQTRRTFRRQTFTTEYRGTISGDTIQGQAEFKRGEQTRSWQWAAERSDPSILTAVAEAPPVAADIDLSDDNYEAWRDHILPELSEMAWAEIPWLSTFKDGILAADAADKPLLLWTMNGHPLGCT